MAFQNRYFEQYYCQMVCGTLWLNDWGSSKRPASCMDHDDQRFSQFFRREFDSHARSRCFAPPAATRPWRWRCSLGGHGSACPSSGPSAAAPDGASGSFRCHVQHRGAY
jgi:hypothetical protein